MLLKLHCPITQVNTLKVVFFIGPRRRIIPFYCLTTFTRNQASRLVEKGIAPAATTNYKIVDGQVVVPPTAQERKGIQPVLTVKANDGKRADVDRPVTLTAVVQVPKGIGKVVAASWNIEGLPSDTPKGARCIYTGLFFWKVAIRRIELPVL